MNYFFGRKKSKNYKQYFNLREIYSLFYFLLDFVNFYVYNIEK
nr:MAG TPA: hypothetical protein [Caudoviricetes sp.]